MVWGGGGPVLYKFGRIIEIGGGGGIPKAAASNANSGKRAWHCLTRCMTSIKAGIAEFN